MTLRTCLPLLVLASLILPGNLGALETDLTAPSDALLQEASAYAVDFGVTLDVAVQRLRLQRNIGALDATLAAKAADIYAGLWIDHQPEYRVTARFTNPAVGRELLLELAAGGELLPLLRVEPATRTLAELEAAQQQIGRVAFESGIGADSEIDVRNNRIEVFVLQTAPLELALRTAKAWLPGGVMLRQVESLAQPDALIGGRPLSSCTSGFTVRHSSGDIGVTTAAHCPNSQVDQDSGLSLPFRAEDQEGNQDVQWHSAPCSLAVTNQFDSGIGIRNVTGTLGRSGQALGAYVCKNGMTTGYTCGNIESKSVSLSYVTNSQATFIRVHHPNNLPLRGPGDSGGPWFVETIAYGTHSGYPTSNPNDAIYMAIDYVSSLGITVLTSTPTISPVGMNLSCSNNYVGSSAVSCWATGYGGRGYYSYSWSYTGNADSFSGYGNSAAAYYSAGCYYGASNIFTVTVSDLCGQSSQAAYDAACYESGCPGCPECIICPF